MADAVLNKIVTDWIPEKATVLDLGCGNGELLSMLEREKHANVQGIEIDEKAIYSCVEKGLSVFHGDIDTGLAEYPDKAFDYIVLNKSLQEIIHPDTVIEEAFRVGNNIIVSFPNFAHINARLRMFFNGRVPITKSLPYSWYNTPNLHFLSIKDFIDYCRVKNVSIERKSFVGVSSKVSFLPNIFAQTAIFHIKKK